MHLLPAPSGVRFRSYLGRLCRNAETVRTCKLLELKTDSTAFYTHKQHQVELERGIASELYAQNVLPNILEAIETSLPSKVYRIEESPETKLLKGPHKYRPSAEPLALPKRTWQTYRR